MTKTKIKVGWREWVLLPELGDDWIKAKVDTGARSSSLHAFDLELFERDGDRWVRFATRPHAGSIEGLQPIELPLLDMRAVKSSSGETEVRPVIRTTLSMADTSREIEITLTNRDEMGFRMLLGRQAMRGAMQVDPGASFVTGHPPRRGERSSFDIAGMRIGAGTQMQVALPIARLATGTQVSLPILVLHGQMDGPTVWLNAAIHGDEIGGVEIIRQVLESLNPQAMRGSVVVVPVVNVHGFVTGDRYLPDRRDLNRSFPGGPTGSLARRIAHMLISEVVARCSMGIDLHTGSDGRTNLPQIRADLSDPTTERLARAFGAPIMVDAKPREGTLRGAATAAGATVLLYEGGEAWRFDAVAIEAGRRGVLRVFAELGIIDEVVPRVPSPIRADGSRWVRASRSGLAHLSCSLGDVVEKGQLLGRIHDSFGTLLSRCKSPVSGLIIGLRLEPMVNRGDALIHVATTVPEESS